MQQKLRAESCQALKRVDRINQRVTSSVATTNDLSELQRFNRIKHAPIENLVMDTKSYAELKPLKKLKNRNATTAPAKRQQPQNPYSQQMPYGQQFNQPGFSKRIQERHMSHNMTNTTFPIGLSGGPRKPAKFDKSIPSLNPLTFQSAPQTQQNSGRYVNHDIRAQTAGFNTRNPYAFASNRN